ncbi:PST family polysaccharide transporter [Scopulibacillus daqui]|uniref:PST family polysaccharide transporter n=1 Tax=Scopulibacillus daqui TaxID=1469162 RepID=A0ABS2PZR5_9BACL|nr:oligosaccharide flippase family protein [Scopulibacillus daqui]MBM7645060.1 PST family polysaccharide transporter [Scopulibacillus daqui]
MELMQKIANKLTQNNKVMLGNFMALMILQGANYLLPLLTLPYILRVLGTEHYGLITFAQAFTMYFTILTDYGFNLSATKEISVHRHNIDEMSKIFTSVIAIKFVILFISFFILIGMVSVVDKFHQDPLVFYFAFGVVIGNVLFPLWFFQGVEKMKYITILNVISRIIYAASIFIFVKKASDYLYVPLINSLATIIIGMMSLFLVFKHYRIRCHFNWPYTVELLKSSFFFFLSRGSLTLYTVTNSMIIGFLFSTTQVGYYSLAEKIVNIIIKPFELLNSAIYPNMAAHKNKALIKKVIKWTGSAGFIIFIIVLIFAKPIILILGGHAYLPSVNVLRFLSLMIVFISIHTFLGTTTLVVFGYSKAFNLSTIYGALFYIAVLGIAYAAHVLNIATIALFTALVEMFILLYRIYYIKKYKIL